MTKRRTAYLDKEGHEHSGPGARAEYAKFITPSEAVFFARSATTILPVNYFLGTGGHETGDRDRPGEGFAINEIDYEPPSKAGRVVITKGYLQLMDEEADEVGMHSANLFDPMVATVVFARLQEKRLRAIERQVMKLFSIQAKRPDVWAYLALSHNQGPGACAKTIREHGLDWERYKGRNPGAPILAYGDDCITGGEWAEAATGRNR